MRDGDTAYCALTWNDAQAPQTYDEAYTRLVRTADYWHEWLAHGDFPDHPWRPYLQRTALTLKGLTYAPTGAMVAAATTSLPETPGASATGTTATRGSATPRSCSGASTRSASTGRPTTSSTSSPTSRAASTTCRSCTGSGASGCWRSRCSTTSTATRAPSRCGSATAPTPSASTTCGATILDSFYLHTKSRDGLPDRFWPILCKQVEKAITHWREPDRGIWEVRGEPKHFTSSKVMCWVACDRGARLARMREEHDQAERWQAAADEIHADVLEHGVDERGVFVQHYETDALDASLLLLPLVRFLPPEDPRIRATVMAIADELTVDGLVLRYKVEETDDGLAGEEGTFAICSFWLVSALGRDRRVLAGPRAVRAHARASPARCCCTRRRSTRARAGTWATSRRRSPISP